MRYQDTEDHEVGLYLPRHAGDRGCAAVAGGAVSLEAPARPTTPWTVKLSRKDDSHIAAPQARILRIRLLGLSLLDPRVPARRLRP